MDIYTPCIDDATMRLFGRPTKDEVTDPEQRRALDIVAAGSECPNQCAFIGDLVVIASLDSKGRPDLTIQNVAEFNSDHVEFMDDDD